MVQSHDMISNKGKSKLCNILYSLKYKCLIVSNFISQNNLKILKMHTPDSRKLGRIHVLPFLPLQNCIGLTEEIERVTES